ncbi:MAG: hypothetical protein U0941_26090 [Planctomycetaceae bacterium]
MTAFINLMRAYGIIEMVRTGRIALSRNSRRFDRTAPQPPPAYEEAVL